MVQVIFALRQEASNTKVIKKIDVSAGIGKSHETENQHSPRGKSGFIYRY